MLWVFSWPSWNNNATQQDNTTFMTDYAFQNYKNSDSYFSDIQVSDDIHYFNIFDLSVCTKFLFNSADWIFSYSEAIYAFNYKLTYFKFLNYFFQDSFDMFFISIWYLSINTINLQLFWSVILDLYIFSGLNKFEVTEEWFRNFYTSKDATLIILHHPETLFINNQINQFFFLGFLSNVSVVIYDYLHSESLLPAVMLLPQLLFVVYVSVLFISFYFSFYSSSVKEESTIDSDYLSTTALVESEKEIGSFDDILMSMLIFLYCFGWYFYLNFWTSVTSFPEFTLVFYFGPVLYFLILSIPFLLLYDFGILYTAYLKGVALSSLPIFELLYDYIAILAFFVRLLVQGVRLVLMFFVYVGMHDTIVYLNYDQKLLTNCTESIWDELSNLNVSADSFSYFMLFILPKHILYWQYELFHTFFVVTAQMVAYFAMIFWLFFFLYTLFVLTKQEEFFQERKRFRKDLLKRLKDIKK